MTQKKLRKKSINSNTTLLKRENLPFECLHDFHVAREVVEGRLGYQPVYCTNYGKGETNQIWRAPGHFLDVEDIIEFRLSLGTERSSWSFTYEGFPLDSGEGVAITITGDVGCDSLYGFSEWELRLKKKVIKTAMFFLPSNDGKF